MNGAVGRHGIPVHALARLPGRRLFPRLWRAGIDMTFARSDGRGGPR
jgi:hypothetical protein